MQGDLDRDGGLPGLCPPPLADPGSAAGVGLLPLFSPDRLREEWWSPRINPWLRQVILIAELLYREYGARPRIVRILGETEPYRSGNGCEIAAAGLPLGGFGKGHNVERYPRWVAQRLSYLYAYGDGSFETATYLPAVHRIAIRVPPVGYRRDAQVCADWGSFGSTPGRVLHPFRPDV